MARKSNHLTKQEALEVLIDDILSDIDTTSALQQMFQTLLEHLMKKERELHFENDEENKANGYYPRGLACMLGNLKNSSTTLIKP